MNMIKLMQYKEIIEKISIVKNTKPNPIIAIDGKCASGKTTLANFLAEIFDCNIIHMDDFFLPPTLRTNKRLASAGGNIHYERFSDEVICGLKGSKDFSYRIFDCSLADYAKTALVNPKKMSIIEGSYSHHPSLVTIYDMKIFLTIKSEEQRSRILARNGEKQAVRFFEEWIPMENKYFKTYNIEQNSDIVIENSKN